MFVEKETARLLGRRVNAGVASDFFEALRKNYNPKTDSFETY